MLVAVGALALTLLLRAACVARLPRVLTARARRSQQMQPRMQDMREQMNTPGGKQEMFGQVNSRRRAAP